MKLQFDHASFDDAYGSAQDEENFIGHLAAEGPAQNRHRPELVGGRTTVSQ
jgi:hypothetical protein